MKLTLSFVQIVALFIGCENNLSQKYLEIKDNSILDSYIEASVILSDVENKRHYDINNDAYGGIGKEDKSTSEVKNSYINETCDLANNIREFVLDFLNKTKTKGIYSEEFVQMLKKNNKNAGSNCFFPRNNEEAILLYDFTNKLNKLSLNDLNATKLIISLILYNSNNVEYSEYGQDIIPSIAIKNTENFIRALNEENIQNQNIIIENLDYIKSMEEVEILERNLSGIDEKSLRPTTKRVEKFINDTFYE